MLPSFMFVYRQVSPAAHRRYQSSSPSCRSFVRSYVIVMQQIVFYLQAQDMGCLGSKDRLSKEDMDFLKSHTRYDESTIKEWYKGFKQDCPNGKLTPAKFVDMYKMFFPSGNAEEFCDHVFRTFDMDKNGYIDFKEFLLAIDVTSSGTPEEKLKWAFRMYDVDGNGVIDIQEMTKIVQAIYDMLGACSSNKPADSAEERAKNIFAKMDENNDGQLTQDEFLKGCLQDEELSKMLAP
ncbi:neuronal calcium sensor 2 isoform X1 [Anopheles darlingi]|uniref:neuronal calcium sensor 2 isoform X1 n=1 Tax=Anopheles darlingi TaxID=43151 RepID=UPI00210009D1|nr:neuronal calcium sensor 2 isoform X1 [Anopheles darlingi]